MVFEDHEEITENREDSSKNTYLLTVIRSKHLIAAIEANEYTG